MMHVACCRLEYDRLILYQRSLKDRKRPNPDVEDFSLNVRNVLKLAVPGLDEA